MSAHSWSFFSGKASSHEAHVLPFQAFSFISSPEKVHFSKESLFSWCPEVHVLPFQAFLFISSPEKVHLSWGKHLQGTPMASNLQAFSLHILPRESPLFLGKPLLMMPWNPGPPFVLVLMLSVWWSAAEWSQAKFCPPFILNLC